MSDAKVMTPMPRSPKTFVDWADWIDNGSDRHATHAVKLRSGKWTTASHERLPFGRFGMSRVDELDRFADMLREAHAILGERCASCGHFEVQHPYANQRACRAKVSHWHCQCIRHSPPTADGAANNE